MAILAIAALALFAACGGGLSEAEERYIAGIEHSERGEWEDALADFDAVIDLEPNLALAYANRAVAHSNLRNFDAAVADGTRAIELDPDDPFPYANRGFAHAELGNPDAALADMSRAFDAAIDLDRTLALAYANRGFAHAELGNPDAALADMSRAIDLGSNDFDLFFARGNIHCARGDFALALDDWEVARSLTDNPSNLADLDALVEEEC